MTDATVDDGAAVAPASTPSAPPAQTAEQTTTVTAEQTTTPKQPGRPAWWEVVVAVAAAAWVLVVARFRFLPAFDRWRAETDAKQVTYQFYSYFDPGTLPAGELLEQYADIYNAPPFYKALMALLSTFVDAKDAAVGLSLVVFLATVAVIGVAAGRRGGVLVGVAAAVLYAHAEGAFLSTVGGHPRTFGPLFFALFLLAIVEQRRGLLLAVLVLCGGTYPSPLLACGPAAAIVVFVDAVQRRTWRPLVPFAVASMLALGLAKAQDLRAPREWGRIITYDEARQHPAWQPGSRFPYTPLPTFWKHPKEAVNRLTDTVGQPIVNQPRVGGRPVLDWVWGGLVVAGLGASLLRRRAGLLAPELLLLASTLFAHWLARHMAFSLHIPHRAVAHGWPVVLAVLVPVAVAGLLARLGRRPASVVTVALTAVPLLALAGDAAVTPNVWRDYSRDAKLYEWIQKKTPKDALFAGNFQIMDEVPLFGRRRAYVNWKLAHPYRLGYFDIVTERTRAMYAALYAKDAADVVRFADATGVDYLIVDETRFKKFESGDGQLFEPLRSKVQPLFKACEQGPCAMNPPPKPAVVFSSGRYRVVSIEKLRALVGPR